MTTETSRADGYTETNTEVIEKALYCLKQGATESVENWLDLLRERLSNKKSPAPELASEAADQRPGMEGNLTEVVPTAEGIVDARGAGRNETSSKASRADTLMDLLPCPFCGGEPKRMTLNDEANFGGDVIVCTKCDCNTHVEFGEKSGLVDAWNLRTPVEQPAAAQIHPDDLAVDRFAIEMKAKLATARTKGRGGWEECPPVDLSRMLREHVEKGDPRDVAIFGMFLWYLNAPISKVVEAADACAHNWSASYRERMEWIRYCSKCGLKRFDSEQPAAAPVAHDQAACSLVNGRGMKCTCDASDETAQPPAAAADLAVAARGGNA